MVLRGTLFLLWLQMAGTFQVLVFFPMQAFQGGNFLFPTLEGQYVIKNLAIIAGALVIGSTVTPYGGGARKAAEKGKKKGAA